MKKKKKGSLTFNPTEIFPRHARIKSPSNMARQKTSHQEPTQLSEGELQSTTG